MAEVSDTLFGGPKDLDSFDEPTLAGMAQAIEDEFDKVRIANDLSALPKGDDARDRRMLFLAIARGVVRHLEERQVAFRAQLSASVSRPVTIATTTTD